MVTPTPLRAGEHDEPSADPVVTYEHVRYEYKERPDDAQHHVSITPEDLIAALRQHGLARAVRASLSEKHGGVRYVWSDRLAQAGHVVCLDAHLDFYAVGRLVAAVPGPDGKRLEVEYRPHYREMAAGLPSLGYLGPEAAQKAIAAAWEQAWALLLLEGMPQLRTFTWIAPDHFGAGLRVGFPYPYAQWMKTLDEGRDLGIWRYELNGPAREILLQFTEPALSGRSLTLKVVTLRECPWLDGVDAERVHVCRSPNFLPRATDDWVDTLMALLNAP